MVTAIHCHNASFLWPGRLSFERIELVILATLNSLIRNSHPNNKIFHGIIGCPLTFLSVLSDVFHAVLNGGRTEEDVPLSEWIWKVDRAGMAKWLICLPTINYRSRGKVNAHERLVLIFCYQNCHFQSGTKRLEINPKLPQIAPFCIIISKLFRGCMPPDPPSVASRLRRSRLSLTCGA